MRLAPFATSTAVAEDGPRATTFPASGGCGSDPASLITTTGPNVSRPVGTMLSNAISSSMTTVEPDTQHPIVMPVGHEEALAVRLEGVLHSGRDEVVGRRRMLDRPGTDVGERREQTVGIEAVNPHGGVTDVVAVDDIAPDHRHEDVRRAVDEGDIHRPTDTQHLGWQTFGERGDLAGPPVDTQHTARIRVGHVQRTVGPDRAARCQTGSERCQRRQLWCRRS